MCVFVCVYVLDLRDKLLQRAASTSAKTRRAGAEAAGRVRARRTFEPENICSGEKATHTHTHTQAELLEDSYNLLQFAHSLKMLTTAHQIKITKLNTIRIYSP